METTFLRYQTVVPDHIIQTVNERSIDDPLTSDRFPWNKDRTGPSERLIFWKGDRGLFQNCGIVTFQESIKLVLKTIPWICWGSMAYDCYNDT